jgi:hypothetical protein
MLYIIRRTLDATNDIAEIGKPTRERYVMLETCYVSVMDSLDTQMFIVGQKNSSYADILAK